MDGIHQLNKLLQRRGVGIEFGQGRIHVSKTQCGIWAAKASHAGIGGWGWVYGE